eukprot:13715685-Alexandrium_andersonii.AAC.1
MEPEPAVLHRRSGDSEIGLPPNLSFRNHMYVQSPDPLAKASSGPKHQCEEAVDPACPTSKPALCTVLNRRTSETP